MKHTKGMMLDLKSGWASSNAAVPYESPILGQLFRKFEYINEYESPSRTRIFEYINEYGMATCNRLCTQISEYGFYLQKQNKKRPRIFYTNQVGAEAKLIHP